MKIAVLAAIFAILALATVAHTQDFDQVLEDAFAEVMADSSSTATQTCTVTASSLKLRSSAGTWGSVVTYMSRGTTVTRLDSATHSGSGYSWYKVRTASGRTGYTAKNYLSCSSSSSGSGSGSGSSSGHGSSKCAQGSKLRDSLKMIFSSEGKCQNWRQDSGNWMNGNLGYTCAGIIPSVGYKNKNLFSYASSCLRGASHMFVKCAWDISNSKFNDGAAKIYENSYVKAGGCSHLPQPAYYVCFDIAVNSGPGRTKQFMRELGAYNGDAIGYANKLNERHRSFYIAISKPGTKNNRFRNGWLRRADHRKDYINSCR